MNQAAQETAIEPRDIPREPRFKPKNAPREVTHTVTLVPPEHLYSLWFEVQGHLAPAVARSNGRWSMEFLYASIVSGHQHLWLAFDQDKHINGVGTTEFIDYPCKRMLAVQFLGGENFNDWCWEMLDRFNSWATDNGCQGIEVTGRSGFWKWLEQDGFTRSYTVYEKRLDHHG